jgi:hypothetical protein
MTDLIKYPKWQPEYLAAVMEGNVAELPEKVFRAEIAIFNRHQALVTSDGTDDAEELEALEDATKGLRVLKIEKLNHPDWKRPGRP